MCPECSGGDSLGGVGAVGDERVYEQLVAVARGDVQWRVAILVFTVNFRPCKTCHAKISAADTVSNGVGALH